MAVFKTIRNHFFSAFREVFVYHNTSLEFRAKTYALIIVAADEPFEGYRDVLDNIAMEIYAESERATTLVMTVREYVDAIQVRKTMNEQTLLGEIIQELRLIPRYAAKLEPEHLKKLSECTRDAESRIYQRRIIDFLSQKRLEFEQFKR